MSKKSSKTLVMKFGGTSVGSLQAMAGVVQIVKDARADWPRVLPKDGRDLALEHCQGCHIITVVVTQDRTKKFWVGTLNTPAHAIIKITPEQRQELASYLELNANIPIDQVPEELRAAGATY